MPIQSKSPRQAPPAARADGLKNDRPRARRDSDERSHPAARRDSDERSRPAARRDSDERSRLAARPAGDDFFVCGIHPVEEALATIPAETLSRARLFVADSRVVKDLDTILHDANAIGIPTREVSMQALSQRTGETRHQGVLLELPKFAYRDLDDVLDHLSPHPLILVLDLIQDPHNLGAIIRSAAAFGADAVVIAKDRAAQVTPTCIKTSAGQAYRVPICRVSNIAQTLRQLKDLDFCILGADVEGDSVEDVDFHRATALVMGSEGDGMRRLTRTLCDQMVHIPQNPAVESLNVSVATAILLYTAARARTLPWH